MSLQIPCSKCGELVEVDPEGPVADLAKAFGTYCERCMTEQTRAELPASVRRPFEVFCPPCFSDTNFEHLPCPGKSILAMEWVYCPEGLNLWGYPGTGKTRTITLILKRMYQAGHTIIALGPGGFRDGCQKRNWKRAAWLEKLSNVDLLFIDDLDKMNLTGEMEKDLFSVLTNRMGRRPVLLTGNSTAKSIEYQFRLGEPMVRRIRDHCRSIHFDKSDLNPLPLPL